MLEAIASVIERYSLLPARGVVVVAVSGGADSLCLLHVLYQLCGPGKRYPQVQLHVAHLNHQLRGQDSEQDAEAVAALAQDWQLPYAIRSVDVALMAAQEHRSLEEAARVARYRFLREVAQGQPIAVAHHKDDQAETLLLHWLRGGGIASQVGLQPQQQDIIRPLLNVSRADIQNYCSQHQLIPHEDASNSDLRFLRNRIRHELLPLLEAMNPGFRATLLRNAEVMQVDFAWIQAQVLENWPQVVVQEQTDSIQLSIPTLRSLPLSVQRHLLRHATAQLCHGQSPLELRHYLLLEQLLQRPTSTEIVTLHLPQHLHALRQSDILIFNYCLEQANENEESPPDTELMLVLPGTMELTGTPWTVTAEWVAEALTAQVQIALQRQDWTTVWELLPATAYTVYVDADTLDTASFPLALRIRTRRNGDRMQPLGMAREKKIKDILIDKHIPRTVRARLPLFFSGSRCIWLGGVQIDQRVRLTEHTHRILRLSIIHRQ
ncbi:tRNA(Ile)-lysidine synthase [Dictyobacter vulcani]|uniref:tRNA(Ile)-lysidine synthase n=1 Tax=Dictyobacter vulcani TaxID=2607529 RepID=A0A5J4KK00_9CHLR|nr:tRNA lysidine(34) synthetase TilS [Dictyobacter vulcani]GER88145.1 tRNA(Ile)-lysidine synthase [Dictyobacter vulcani]